MLKFISQKNVVTIMGQDIDAVMAAAAKVIAAWDGKKYLKEPVEELRRAIKLTHLESLSNS
jgi:Mg-chelatase subunit ChlI|tara:strand:+ start:323 stop:505 length:183 start_codon:yes stop_codon:yes gene_type:complete